MNGVSSTLPPLPPTESNQQLQLANPTHIEAKKILFSKIRQVVMGILLAINCLFVIGLWIVFCKRYICRVNPNLNIGLYIFTLVYTIASIVFTMKYLGIQPKHSSRSRHGSRSDGISNDNDNGYDSDSSWSSFSSGGSWSSFDSD